MHFIVRGRGRLREAECGRHSLAISHHHFQVDRDGRPRRRRVGTLGRRERQSRPSPRRERARGGKSVARHSTFARLRQFGERGRERGAVAAAVAKGARTVFLRWRDRCQDLCAAAAASVPSGNRLISALYSFPSFAVARAAGRTRERERERHSRSLVVSNRASLFIAGNGSERRQVRDG